MDLVSPPTEIYLYREDQYLGPYTEKELRRHWANGVVEATDLIWYEGMAEWVPLRDYFGIPAALTSGAIPNGYISPAELQARFAAPLQEEEASFEYKGHPAAQAGWVVFISWSLLGASLLVAVLIPHHREVVIAAGSLAFIAAVFQWVRLRNASSAGLVMACLLLPALFWWLAVTYLPKSEPSTQAPLAKESPQASSVMAEQSESNVPKF
jgi:hypothetical protein